MFTFHNSARYFTLADDWHCIAGLVGDRAWVPGPRKRKRVIGSTLIIVVASRALLGIVAMDGLRCFVALSLSLSQSLALAHPFCMITNIGVPG